MGGSLGELAAFMEKQQCLLMEREDKMEAKLESQRLEAKAERLEAKAERAALEAKVESQRVALEAKVESDRVALHDRMEEMKLASEKERRDKEVRELRLFQSVSSLGKSMI